MDQIADVQVLDPLLVIAENRLARPVANPNNASLVVRNQKRPDSRILKYRAEPLFSLRNLLLGPFSFHHASQHPPHTLKNTDLLVVERKLLPGEKFHHSGNVPIRNDGQHNICLERGRLRKAAIRRKRLRIRKPGGARALDYLGKKAFKRQG